VQGIFISLGVHRNGLNPEFVACPNDSKRYLTAIRDEYFFER
jgi:hypothetical protein